MPGAQPGRWCCQRLRLGLAAAGLLALAVLALLGHAMSQAEPPPFAPQALAFFPADDKLVVALTGPGSDREPLTVELIGPDGKRIARGKRSGPRFELAASK